MQPDFTTSTWEEFQKTLKDDSAHVHELCLTRFKKTFTCLEFISQKIKSINEAGEAVTVFLCPGDAPYRWLDEEAKFLNGLLCSLSEERWGLNDIQLQDINSWANKHKKSIESLKSLNPCLDLSQSEARDRRLKLEVKMEQGRNLMRHLSQNEVENHCRAWSVERNRVEKEKNYLKEEQRGIVEAMSNARGDKLEYWEGQHSQCKKLLDYNYSAANFLNHLLDIYSAPLAVDEETKALLNEDLQQSYPSPSPSI